MAAAAWKQPSRPHGIGTATARQRLTLASIASRCLQAACQHNWAYWNEPLWVPIFRAMAASATQAGTRQ